MGGDFHNKAFDEATLVKLGLFRDYVSAWLPVFTTPSGYRGAPTIADFFAGPGQDLQGRPGSPLIALQEIRKRQQAILELGSPVRLLLNEKAKGKYAMLRQTIAKQRVPESLCEVVQTCDEFEAALEEAIPRLHGGPNLLFLDQQGVRFITDEVFAKIIALRLTDFLFFIASSSLNRFADHPYFQKHIRIPRGTISARRFSDCHRVVADYYRSLIPPGETYYLGKFSIKKGSNLYGVIFGSHHPLGMEKFLRVAWRVDPTTGEANFDIDGDGIDPSSPHLFSEMDRSQKLVLFQASLRDRLCRGQITTDRDVYLTCLLEGFLPIHGREVLVDLVKAGTVEVEPAGTRPRVSMDGYRDPRRLTLRR